MCLGGVLSVARAQVVEVVGGNFNRSGARSAAAKANSYRVDQTTRLIEIECWLEIPAAETLTFFVYRAGEEFGVYSRVLETARPVVGTGAAYYSSGAIDVELLTGNHYIVGVSWPGTLHYFFNRGQSEATSFGAQTHGYATGSHPLGQTVTSALNDLAIFHQRLSTVPLTGRVDRVGAPCHGAGGMPPRLVINAPPLLQSPQFAAEVYGAPASVPAYFMFAGVAATTPIPLFGCDFLLDPGILLATAGPLTTDAAGHTSLIIPIGPDPQLAGLTLAIQSIQVVDLANAILTFTNAIEFRIG